ncbi:MAG TPA: TM2 domain-containing protein [Gemmatimonadales bacterium]|nr:TM2 domain-containing protein [Gemmatimonadales bacterium]
MTSSVGGRESYDADAEPTPVDAVSERSRAVALTLGLVGGMLGLHRFYAGRPGSGVAMICTLGGLGIWWLYDVILLAAGEFRDGSDRRIRTWLAAGPVLEPGTGERRVDQLAAQVGRLERELAELAERVDFAERLLAQYRERGRLPNS